MSKLLNIIGTPIGNLGDISKRMIDTLSSVDIIYAEDTRSTLKLLNHLNIKKQLRSSHKDNEYENIEEIFNEIALGKSVGIVSDAGMPTISDPGNIIVATAISRGVEFDVIPAPTALISALIMSGLSGHDFYFYGFLSHEKSKKMKEIEGLKSIKSPIILYESPHRVIETLKMILEIFAKKIAVCREITKLHENCTFINTVEDINSLTVKGEFTLVIDNTQKDSNEDFKVEEITIDITTLTKKLLKDGISSADILTVLKNLGVKRNEAYKLIESLK